MLGLEDLNIAGMKKNHHLSKAISGVGWGYFKTFLSYKAAWYGRRIVEADRFFASSQNCLTPNCGYVNKALKLSDHFWTCLLCGHLHDRDENSGDNLLYVVIAAVTVPPERRERGSTFAKSLMETKTSDFVFAKEQDRVLATKQEAARPSQKKKLPTFGGE